MRVVYNGRPVNPSSVDWGQVDIRRFGFVQSAGPHNVLGVVKFMFPNKHDIYMHDTPQRELLDKPRRDVQPRLHARAGPRASGRAAARGGQGVAGGAGARHAGARLQQRGRADQAVPGARDVLHGGGRRRRTGELPPRHLRLRQPHVRRARRQAAAAAPCSPPATTTRPRGTPAGAPSSRISSPACSGTEAGRRDRRRGLTPPARTSTLVRQSLPGVGAVQEFAPPQS